MNGTIVASGNGQGNSFRHIYFPKGVMVDQLGQIYVAAGGNYRVMRWYEGAKERTIVVGWNVEEGQLDQFNCSCSLSFDREDHLYVADWGNHRIEKFEIV